MCKFMQVCQEVEAPISTSPANSPTCSHWSRLSKHALEALDPESTGRGCIMPQADRLATPGAACLTMLRTSYAAQNPRLLQMSFELVFKSSCHVTLSSLPLVVHHHAAPETTNLGDLERLCILATRTRKHDIAPGPLRISPDLMTALPLPGDKP